MPYPSTPFEQNYRCYSASFIDKVNFLLLIEKPWLDEGGYLESR